MTETQQSRLEMQVFVLGHDGVPVGSGFVCSHGHVMTCAHVVADALDGGDAMADGAEPPTRPVRVRFAVDSSIEAESEIVAEAWRPRGSPGCDDVAVLRVVRGQPWPTEAKPVTLVAEDPAPRTEFIGLGVSENEAEGVIIEGRIGGLLPGNRLSIHADSIDQKVVPGCSGAAVFTYARGGMAGMVVEMQQTATGLMIPARLLRTVWPMAVADGPAGPVFAASAPASIKHLLAKRLPTFDREDQGLSFEAAVQLLWQQDKLPIICLIGGLEADLPDKCQERCLTLNLRQSLGVSLPIDRLIPLHIPWPPIRLFNVEQTLAGLKRALKAALDADDVTPDAIREARSRAGRAFFFFSTMRADKFSSRHAQLITAWSEFLASTSGGQIDDDDPVLHFIHVVLSNSDFRPRRADPDEPLRYSFRRLTRGLETGIVRPLPALGGFGDSLVDNWLARVAQELALPADQADALIAAAQDKFVPMRHARLRDLRDWINTLN